MKAISQTKVHIIENKSVQTTSEDLSNDAINREKSARQNYNGKEVKVVKKANLKPSSNIDTSAFQTKSQRNNVIVQKEYDEQNINPLNNINLQKLAPKVIDKIGQNKIQEKDLFDGISLVYIIEAESDSGSTNYQTLMNVWKKEKHFISLNKLGANKFSLYLNAYFDTEESEEIMTQNNLKVIFKDEYYTITELEK